MLYRFMVVGILFVLCGCSTLPSSGADKAQEAGKKYVIGAIRLESNGLMPFGYDGQQPSAIKLHITSVADDRPLTFVIKREGKPNVDNIKFFMQLKLGIYQLGMVQFQYYGWMYAPYIVDFSFVNSKPFELDSDSDGIYLGKMLVRMKNYQTQHEINSSITYENNPEIKSEFLKKHPQLNILDHISVQ